MKQETIAVIGATGLQGKGVIEALVKDGSFTVRAITRNPKQYTGPAHEVVQGDLKDVDSLAKAFAGAYGVFVVTNFWEGADEMAQGKNAVEAAKGTGIEHFIWSTLPNVEAISKGSFDVPHFTLKAKVDELVKNAGFRYFTFVQPPFYFQNLTGQLAPQPKDDGTTGWTLPIDPAKKVIHMSDINDLGKVVAGSFLNPGKVGQGSYLSLATELYSFKDVMDIFKLQGIDYSFTQVPAEVFSTFFEGAKEISEMLSYFEAYTYMGPNSYQRIEAAREIATENLTSLTDWIKLNNA